MFISALPVWSGELDVNQYINLLQKFSLEQLRPLRMRIRVHGNYAVYINGILIDFGQYPDYDEYCVVDELLISAEVLKIGENVLSILAYSPNEDSSTYRKGVSSAIFEITDGKKVILSSGEKTLCRNERCYHSGNGVEKISLQLGYSFYFDARNSDCWMSGNNIDSFQRVELLQKPKRYYKRPIKRLQNIGLCPAAMVSSGSFMNSNENKSVSVNHYTAFLKVANSEKIELTGRNIELSSDGGDGVFCLIDLKKERAGYFHLDYFANEDCLVEIGYGEHINDLRVRSCAASDHFAAAYYGTSGDNCFTHYFTRFAGRYVQLHFHTDKLILRYAGLNEYVYPVKNFNTPKHLDEFEKRIYHTGIDTLKLCMHEHYEDCPWREQALYAMDSRNQMLFGYVAFREYQFAKASLRLLGLGLRNDGLLELCAPARVPVVIPVFSLMWVVALCEYAQASGDYAFVKQNIPVVRKIFHAFNQRICKKTGLVSLFVGDEYWNFYEWTDGLAGSKTGNETDCLINLFYSYALKKICFIADDKNELNMYKKQYETLKKAINDNFWDSSANAYGLYIGGNHFPEIAQALAVVSGVANNMQRRKIISGLKKNLYMPKTALSSKIFVYDALLTAPSSERFVREDIKSIWGKMLFSGATSFWETEKGCDDFNGAGSLCHGWSAVPVYIYHCLGKNNNNS